MSDIFYRSLLCCLTVLSLEAQQTPAEVYRLAKDAVVTIEGKQKAGTGFIISDDGLVVTNYHVVSGESQVTVKLANGLQFETDDVAARDADSDIAVLRLKGRGFPKLTLGDSERVSPGDRVFVISNPLGLERSISEGLVSGIRDIEAWKVLQISAPISPGSSGAPVLDLNGSVIGVAAATFRGGQNVI